MAQEKTLAELLTESAADYLVDKYFALPARVVGVHDTLKSLKVDILPLTKIVYGDGSAIEHQVIDGVQVVMLGTEDTLVSFPIKIGSTVLAVFLQRDATDFRYGKGDTYVPQELRMFSEMDAVVIPGLFPFPKSPNNPAVRTLPHNTEDLVLSHNIGTDGESEVRIKKGGGIQINCPNGGVVVNAKTASVSADSATINVPTTTWTGDITHTGTLISNGIQYDTHIHSGVLRGPGATDGPQ
jgi:hypothetical protein